MRKNRLRWLMHILRREQTEVKSKINCRQVEKKEGKGRLKKRFLDVMQSDLKLPDYSED